MNKQKTDPESAPATCGARSELASNSPAPGKDMTLIASTAARLARLASLRSPRLTGSYGHPVAALLLRLSCTALLAWIGYLHLHLWQEGYRQIPTTGPLFLLDAAAGFMLAAVLLAWPRPLAGLLAAGYTACTLGALIISLAVGLFGFRESISAAYVVQSLTIETITVLALIGWTVLAAGHPQSAARTRLQSLSETPLTKVREHSAEGNRAP